MKIPCTCGAVIHDGPDGLPHKGQAEADREWNPIRDAVDAVLDGAKDPQAAALALRRATRTRRMGECTSRGRLWIEGPSATLWAFSPDSGHANRACFA